MTPRVSICLSTFNKPQLLQRTLQSIYVQKPPFSFETIVVDDGSKDGRVQQICKRFPVRYIRINRDPVFRNPCVARNLAYRSAQGDVLICQSDEVLHIGRGVIKTLTETLHPGIFVLANVFCLSRQGKIDGEYTGPGRKAPYFFLGSIYREDLYAVGGNDEDFAICPAYEDAWFADCLIRGRGLQPHYTTAARGHHQWHEYVSKPETEGPSRELYAQKTAAAERGEIPWCSAGGPWPFRLPADETINVEQVFTDIYRTDGWKGGESRSGAGSSAQATQQIRENLPGLFREYEIRSMLDIPCGDFNWMRLVDLQGLQYVGADIVREMIEANQARYGTDAVTFRYLDLLTSDLPKSDLVLCRDCLCHFSFQDVRRAIANLKRSGSTYLLATTFYGRGKNATIRTGQWTPYDLQSPPFGFAKPIRVINEDCQECYPAFQDKSLGLWRISELPT